MFDEDVKPDNQEQEVIDLEEKSKPLEQEVAELKDDLDQLRKRIVMLEGEMRIVKETLKKMSFAPGL